MSEPTSEFNEPPMSQEELHAAMFAQMVMQFASTALMLMGRMPNPMTGKTETDLDAARLFIDQLEMLEVKTKGNLSADEQHLLKQNLMTVRMAFVQAMEGTKSAPAVTEKNAQAPETKPADTGEEVAAKKKFSKSYGAP
jgi:hypothetical protein